MFYNNNINTVLVKKINKSDALSIFLLVLCMLNLKMKDKIYF